MALQKTVNKELAIGTVGEFYDNSPRVVNAFIGRKNIATQAVKATGTLTATANFSASETVTVGSKTYTFGSSEGQVAVGADLATSLANLAAAINKDGEVVAVATATTIALTAAEYGTAGNSIATTETATNASFGGATLSGGVNEVVYDGAIAKAYTYATTAGEAQVGGSGLFAGIAVNPKEYAIYNNFNPTLAIPDGIGVSLCTFGHLLVKSATAVTIGQAAFFSTADGSIISGTAGSSISNYIEIKNSKFIIQNAAAGSVAILELR